MLAYFRVLRIIAVPAALNIQAYSGPSSRPFIVGVMLHLTYNTSRSRSRSVTPLSIPLASSVFFDPDPSSVERAYLTHRHNQRQWK